MPLKIQQFDCIEDAEFYLRGGVSGGVLALQQGVIAGLHGKTLIFTAPEAKTVTFSDPTGAGLKVSDIVTSVHSVLTGLLISFTKVGLRIIEASPTYGVHISKTGTANTIFGFSNGSDTIGLACTGPTGAVPRLIEMGAKARLDGYFAVIEVS